MSNEAMLDLSKYQNKVRADADKPLFDEAVKSARVRALRGAYILIWLSCLESLKRKFQEAASRDQNAGKIVGKLENQEKEHKSIDKTILSKAQEYGFVSDTAYQKLEHIYEMRCIFGHPYEEAPSVEEVIHAACTVVDQVLSKPTTLKQGYVASLIDRLRKEESYLDDYEPTVRRHAEDITPKLDDSVYTYLVEKYIKEIEPIVHDLSLKLFKNRAIWFLRKFIEIVGCGIYSTDQWHDLFMKYPNILSLILAKHSKLFKEIGQNAQDSIVSHLIKNSKSIPSNLSDLEYLCDEEVLNDRQKFNFEKAIKASEWETLQVSGLKISTFFNKLIEALKFYNWYKQNKAMQLIMRIDGKNFGKLTPKQAQILGRNILQAADGDARDAIWFLNRWIEEPNVWPNNILKGVLLECFLDDDYKFRLKTKRLSTIMKILSNHEAKDRLIKCLYIKLKDSEPKQQWIAEQKEVNATLKILSNYPETALITEYLQNLEIG